MVFGSTNNSLIDSGEIVTADLSQHIYSKLYQYQCSGTLCDVSFSNGDLSISAHSCILAVVSPFMMRYFLSQRSFYGVSGVYQSNIIIPISVVTKMVNGSGDNCMYCFSSVVKYIYTGSIRITKAHFHHIANISCNLEIDELISICQKYINRAELHVKLNNVIDHDKRNSTDPDALINISKLYSKCNEDTLHSCNNKRATHFLSMANKAVSAGKKYDADIVTTNKVEFNNKDTRSTSNNVSYCEIVNTSNPKNSSPTLILKCFDCNEVFNNVLSLSQHKSAFHSNNSHCIYCSFKSDIIEDMIEHLHNYNHGNKCSICLKDFPNSITFISHLNQHWFPLPFTCHKCSLKFQTKFLWKKHLLACSDINKRIFQCSHCSLIFTSRNKIKLHLYKAHMGQICDICGYTTKYASYLKRHLLKHKKKFLYCTFDSCDFQTNRKSNLKEHLRTHVKMSKDFECPLCKISFTLKKNLKRHMSIHNSPQTFNCPECNYKNIRFDKVKDHCKIHTGTKGIFEKLSKQYTDMVSKKNNNESVLLPITKSRAQINKCSPDEEEISSDKIIEYSTDSNKIIYLNEMTGDLTFFCDSDGKPLKGVPNVITVHSIGNIKNTEDSPETFNDSSSTGVILNEITGELNYIELNLESNTSNVCSKPYSKTEVAVTVLDEATGEITSKSEQLSLENDNIFDIENIFDSIDFDAMNDDSFDGFDDFDNALFDAEFSHGSASPDMDKILNEFTGELFTDESTCKLLGKQLNEESMHPLWSNVQINIIQQNTSQVQELAEIFLNEVTGEFTAESSSLKDF